MVDIQKPFQLRGDHFYLLTVIKSIIDGSGFWINPALGYPGVQNSAYYPSFDFSYKLIIWLASLASHNVFVVLHLLYIVCLCLIAASCFFALETLGNKSRILGIAASIAFTVSPCLAVRAGFGHDYLALYYGIPLSVAGAFLLWNIDSWRGIAGFLQRPVIVVSIAVSATSGLYYAFFGAMFGVLTAGAASVVHRTPAPLAAALLVGAIEVIVLVLVGYGPYSIEVVTGQVPQFSRLPVEQLLYGLQISDAIQAYGQVGLFRKSYEYYLSIFGAGGLPTLGLFEWPGPILTTIILLSPLVVLASAGARREALDQSMIVYLSAALISFGLIYAVRGGLGYFFSAIVTPTIRAPTRILIFLSFYATLIYCGASEMMCSKMRTRGALIVMLLSGGLLLAAGFPAYNSLAGIQRRFMSNPIAQEDWLGAVALLQSKDRNDLRAVLQLPQVPWGDRLGPIRDLHPYRHQLPFILDQPRSLTRWSYGLAEAQAEFKAVQEVDWAKPADVVSYARRFGFDAILIEKRAYEVELVSAMMQGIEALGACRVFDDKLRALLVLKASPC